MVDKWVGKLLDKLRKLGLYDDTLIIFLADHGEPLGNKEHGHGIMRKIRPWPYEELVHIPLIIRHPERGSERFPSFVMTPDIAPTILEYLNVEDEHAEEMQGKSLIPLILGKVSKLRDFAIAGYHNFSWSLVRDDWSYIHWLNEGEQVDDTKKMLGFYGEHVAALYGEASKVTGEDDIWSCTPGAAAETPDMDELYDRKKDPFQLNNLIKKEPEVANELFIQLRDYMLELRSS
jgi:arylsulfatase A-like enzyme